ncbi:Electron transfer flavoprotein-ubiquinone oxidoreductase [archaeon HR01]|nr:Electron transfer flavoprotein-ubiquinone oxidoreductase [archaeon HR01]
MNMAEKFDVIVVGAGPAGSAAAITLAREGVDVIVLEKSQLPGHRNVTGGVLYGGFIKGLGMIDLVPEFESEAPLERKAVSHELYYLGDHIREDGSYSYRVLRLDKNSLPTKLGLTKLDATTGHDYTVLRARFDRWLAFKAADEGAMLSLSTTVEDLIWRDGKVAGVITQNDELYADLVIDCGGVTSNLPVKAGIRGKLEPHQVYHGVKHVYKLKSDRIEELFGVDGVARVFYLLGGFMKGVIGGGFIYPNRESLSVGLVLDLQSAAERFKEIPYEIGKPLDLLEEMERHPFVAQLLEGAVRVEYSAHNIPRGYKCLPERPYAPGFLMAGDSLGVFTKIGALIDGMRPAIASGILAARMYLQARKAGDFSAGKLSQYRTLLQPLYDAVASSKRNSMLLESRLVYHRIPPLALKLGLGRLQRYDGPLPPRDERDAVQRIQERTGILDYHEDKKRSHIEVNFEKASNNPYKPWIPLCPVNCYTLATDKGVFASFRDLYRYNLEILRRTFNGTEDALTSEALKMTWDDIRRGSLKFDHVACVACGTCGVLGPGDVISFGHERDGHGVRFRYG